MKTERLQIRITPNLLAQIKAAADEEGRTVTNYVEFLIKQDIRRKGIEEKEPVA